MEVRKTRGYIAPNLDYNLGLISAYENKYLLKELSPGWAQDAWSEKAPSLRQQ